LAPAGGRLRRDFDCADPRHRRGRDHPRASAILRIVARAQIVDNTSRTHDCDDYRYNHGYQASASVVCLSVDVHALRNSLLDVHEADVGSPSADTIKLNFNPRLLRSE
jgi:hypothetical protein